MRLLPRDMPLLSCYAAPCYDVCQDADAVTPLRHAYAIGMIRYAILMLPLRHDAVTASRYIRAPMLCHDAAAAEAPRYMR